ESVNEEVAKARREGTLVLIKPVTTSTDGRCVARTRWIPAARAFCVMRTMETSISFGVVVIKSANSSTTQTINGYGRISRCEPGGAVNSPERTLRLKSLMWRTRADFMSM